MTQRPSVFAIALLSSSALVGAPSSDLGAEAHEAGVPLAPAAAIDATKAANIAGLPAVSIAADRNVCDGGSHPLSGRYPTLAAARAVYPSAQALTDQIDQVAFEKSIAAALATYSFARIVVPSGTCTFSRALTQTVPAGQGLAFEGMSTQTKLVFPAGSDGFAITLAPVANGAVIAAAPHVSFRGMTLMTANATVANTGIKIILTTPPSGQVNALTDSVSLRDVNFEAASGGSPNGGTGAWAVGYDVTGLAQTYVEQVHFYGGAGDTTSVLGVYDASPKTSQSTHHTVAFASMFYGGTMFQVGSPTTTIALQGFTFDNLTSVGNAKDIVANAGVAGDGDWLSVTNSNFNSVYGSFFTNWSSVSYKGNYCLPSGALGGCFAGRRLQRFLIANSQFLGQPYNSGGVAQPTIDIEDTASTAVELSMISGNYFPNFGTYPIKFGGTTAGVGLQGNFSAGLLLNDTTGNTQARGWNLENGRITGPNISVQTNGSVGTAGNVLASSFSLIGSAGQILQPGGLVNAAGVTSKSYTAGTSVGVSCSGVPSASYTVTNGIVTHC